LHPSQFIIAILGDVRLPVGEAAQAPIRIVCIGHRLAGQVRRIDMGGDRLAAAKRVVGVYDLRAIRVVHRRQPTQVIVVPGRRPLPIRYRRLLPGGVVGDRDVRLRSRVVDPGQVTRGVIAVGGGLVVAIHLHRRPPGQVIGGLPGVAQRVDFLRHPVERVVGVRDRRSLRYHLSIPFNENMDLYLKFGLLLLLYRLANSFDQKTAGKK
jgi:hypothetical protein